ncbi:HD domain-containing phosphohydrolase [uncultured Sphaerochaeta sp.]|uniref:HD domain-containing phosphohydrolase n=1 Tax=uncultured Sphaerochaeta sp. TaxID=886478 RepID=UPI002A0A1D75|nr:HD domain-containing phosphohydrolase [uncultured Sphaerochaeta sp.]
MVKPKILIVDDEPINLSVLNTLLNPFYQISACKTGEEALKLLRLPSKPDLILLDIMMPQMDGYETLSHIREDKATQDIPVIYISALDSSTDEEKGFHLGAVDYISKPFKPAIVLERIKVHLELKEARDKLRNQNEWLEEEINERIHENFLILDAAFSVITQLVETRDTDTANHTLRTKAYVRILAKKLQQIPKFKAQLDKDTLERIVKTTPFHDIGKIGIPDAILLKPGRLTPEEFKIMKTHCVIGGGVLQTSMRNVLAVSEDPEEIAQTEAFKFLKQAKDIAMYHHERWDGQGYPEGLKGEEIPFSARMMSLADVFDALVTPRVYKKAWSFEDTAKYIKEQRGIQFDPDIVDAFEAEQEAFKKVLILLGDS